MEPPLAYMPVAVPAPLAATSLPVKKLAEAAAATPVCGTGPASHYQLEHKEFIVLAWLTAQPMFDNKLHKNEQLWDYISTSFYAKFPDQCHRTKNSIKDQFNIQQKAFLDFCKTNRTFSSGQVSGLGRDEQEK
eukprot:1368804-Rhodomonas_salina.1